MSRCKRFWKYYIKGEYHCDNCPYSWEECGYEDSDAGCYIYGELRDSCRLLPPFRFLIGWPRRRKCCYLRDHKYDGFADFQRERDAQEANVRKALMQYLEKRGYIVLQARAIDLPEEATQYIVPSQFLEQIYILSDDMRDIFTPPFEPPKTRWKKIIRDTWKRFTMIFKPYFCK